MLTKFFPKVSIDYGKESHLRFRGISEGQFKKKFFKQDDEVSNSSLSCRKFTQLVISNQEFTKPVKNGC